MRQCENMVRRQAFEAAIRGDDAVSPFSTVDLDQVPGPARPGPAIKAWPDPGFTSEWPAVSSFSTVGLEQVPGPARPGPARTAVPARNAVPPSPPPTSTGHPAGPSKGSPGPAIEPAPHARGLSFPARPGPD